MLSISILPVNFCGLLSLSQSFFKMLYSTTAMSNTIISGRKNSEGICCTARTPKAEPSKDKGNSFFIKFVSILPDLTKVIKLVQAPITAAILLVPRACNGEIPVSISAGNEIIPPPPAAASTKDATKPAIPTKIYISKSI